MTRTVLLLVLLTTVTVPADAALLSRQACLGQCAPSIAAKCLNRRGKVKPACRARLVRQCRHHKDVCTTTTTTTTSTTSTTSSRPTVTTTSTTTTTTLCEGICETALLDFTNGLAGGACGSMLDGSGTELRTLTCGGLNIGGGHSTVLEGPTPDGSTSRFRLSCAHVGTGVCAIQPYEVKPSRVSHDPDCTVTGCNFGTPLPIPNPGNAALTTCVINTWSADATGSVDRDTGASNTGAPLNSDVYITGNLDHPCPRCIAGMCDRGIGTTCVSDNSTGLTRDCPPGGVSPGHACALQGNGERCADESVHVGILQVNLIPLATVDASAAAADGNFCPSQKTAGCFADTTCTQIIEHGQPAGAITAGSAATATLASVFCIPSSGNGLVDIAADLPGPGAVTLPGTFTVR